MRDEAVHQVDGVAALRTLTQAIIAELDIKDADRLIDIGTGSGRLAMALSQLVPKGSVTGIDPSWEQLRAAREAATAHHMRNFELVHGRAEALPLGSEAFDAACFMFSLHHFDNPQDAVEEARRVLKTGGRLVSVDPVVREPSDEEERQLNEIIEEAFQIAHGRSHRLFTVTELERLYIGAGLSIESCHTYDFLFDQADIAVIPQGSHWLQAYNLLRLRRQKGLACRFEQNYLVFREEEGQLKVNGKTPWAVIKAAKGYG